MKKKIGKNYQVTKMKNCRASKGKIICRDKSKKLSSQKEKKGSKLLITLTWLHTSFFLL